VPSEQLEKKRLAVFSDAEKELTEEWRKMAGRRKISLSFGRLSGT